MKKKKKKRFLGFESAAAAAAKGAISIFARAKEAAAAAQLISLGHSHYRSFFMIRGAICKAFKMVFSQNKFLNYTFDIALWHPLTAVPISPGERAWIVFRARLTAQSRLSPPQDLPNLNTGEKWASHIENERGRLPQWPGIIQHFEGHARSRSLHKFLPTLVRYPTNFIHESQNSRLYKAPKSDSCELLRALRL